MELSREKVYLLKRGFERILGHFPNLLAFLYLNFDHELKVKVPTY
jgi:hypothetical protein